ncbi:hypothetical protein AGABI2DRAFT_219773 [Agaricus bisporus var. bisporus H97]|uniref:hypothetical protein n=1 Tax=Agaricus bisporus var. bisporus (strain H97 / ATCC MYA-4626 / FGSC 10389) TaxID=936046 RepID=UPI00029F5A71|nr:hypothetical protein AGABI2DRAFT_219773 [Agaricus bisporus var. bisporus H97]EKV48238.1 hypothetical protein AGABI2DRAFT_219773 [Agaricus bisporus var. bisporus H97]
MLLASLLFIVPVFSAIVPGTSEPHEPSLTTSLDARWYHDSDHPVHALFRRGPTDGVAYAPVGSPLWSADFPESTPDSSNLPKAWVDALDAAVTAGKIPNLPTSISSHGSEPEYPDLDPSGAEICSSTYKCMQNSTNIWNAPDGYFASSFDDGPQPYTDALVEFLAKNKVKTTHFMIGTNILQYWEQFLTAWNHGDDIAVHTWTHPYMTTLSNLDVVAQLGWTMQLVHNSTGGRVPRFWRPPYGDSDNRVTAIAREVFSLETVIWNQDTDDWSINYGGTTEEEIGSEMDKWLSGPKSPGLIILEHEDSDGALNSFMEAFPKIATNGWKFESLARILGGGQAYQNSFDADSEVKPVNLMAGQNNFTLMAKNVSTTTTPSPTSDLGASTAGNLAANTDYPTADPLANAAMTPPGQAQSLKWIFSTVLVASLITALFFWA